MPLERRVDFRRQDVQTEAIEHQSGKNNSAGTADEVGQIAVQRQRRTQPHQNEGLDQQADHEQRNGASRCLDLQEYGAGHGGEGET